jgi:predicted metalloprotease with PDZ domain
MLVSQHHVLRFDDVAAHLVDVELHLAFDAAAGRVTVAMPVWTPGSYLVREYARHVQGFTAMDANGHVLASRKERKDAWIVDADRAQAITVRYRVWCHELTVRTNHADASHALLTAAATFFHVEGARADLPSTVEVVPRPEWSVVVPLPPSDAAPRAGGRCFLAENLDALFDTPISLGVLDRSEFSVNGIPHQYAVWPQEALSGLELTRLVDDTRKLLEVEHQLFGTAPYERYSFLLNLAPDARGGLEHDHATTLLASPFACRKRKDYLDLLTLVAHEAFHLWSVKRIRPQGLAPYKYDRENYTRLLWWFEGGTSYFDWRIVRLAGLCTVEEYLAHVAEELNYVEQTPGRFAQSLEEASFDAWVKLYRPDANTPNSTISYYRKGEVVCFLFDATIRAATAGAKGLDDVQSRLWGDHGRAAKPVPEGAFPEVFKTVTGVDCTNEHATWVRQATDLPVDAVLAKVGLKVIRKVKAEGVTAGLGLRTKASGGRITVSTTLRGSAAERAGISPGDELLAIEGWRVDEANLDQHLRGRDPGDELRVLVARDGRIVEARITLDPARPEVTGIEPMADATPEQRAIVEKWLGALPAAWAPKAPKAAPAGAEGAAS